MPRGVRDGHVGFRYAQDAGAHRNARFIRARGMGGGYDPREMLSDAVATLVFMPTKFERTSFHLAEKFNFSVSDLDTLTVRITNFVK